MDTNYPYSYPISNRSTNTGGYRYFFNGQEGDNEVFGEVALHAFEFRMHDARLGRFWSVDPLAAKYPWNSTYAFAENRVVDGRELEGLEAWTVSRDWNESDVENFALFATSQLKKYEENHIKDDCANFAYRLIVDYAYENRLPLDLKSSSGKHFDSESESYKSYAQYLTSVRQNLGAKDVLSNVFPVSQAESHAGDMEILHYERQNGTRVDFMHVVIFESMDPFSIVMGNLPPKELKRFDVNWPRRKVNNDTKWNILSGENNVRWNMLNFEKTEIKQETEIQD